MATILFVEDSKALQLELGDALTKSGHRVIEALDGKEGVRLAEAHPEISLIITDYNMPGMNGLRMCDEIKKNPHFGNVPIIMVTSHSDSGLRELGRKTGVKVWVIKPVAAVKLLYVVDKLIKAV